MSLFESYLILQLPNFVSLLLPLVVIIMIILTLTYGTGTYLGNEREKQAVSGMRPTVISGALIIIILLLVPNQKTMLTIVGISVVSQNEQAMQLPEKVLELANQELDKLLTKEKTSE